MGPMVVPVDQEGTVRLAFFFSIIFSRFKLAFWWTVEFISSLILLYFLFVMVQPMIYGRGPMPSGMRMVPMVLPDGRLGYVLYVYYSTLLTFGLNKSADSCV